MVRFQMFLIWVDAMEDLIAPDDVLYDVIDPDDLLDAPVQEPADQDCGEPADQDYGEPADLDCGDPRGPGRPRNRFEVQDPARLELLLDLCSKHNFTASGNSLLACLFSISFQSRSIFSLTLCRLLSLGPLIRGSF